MVENEPRFRGTITLSFPDKFFFEVLARMDSLASVKIDAWHQFATANYPSTSLEWEIVNRAVGKSVRTRTVLHSFPK